MGLSTAPVAIIDLAREVALAVPNGKAAMNNATAATTGQKRKRISFPPT
jgi:hypothetical protein